MTKTKILRFLVLLIIISGTALAFRPARAAIFELPLAQGNMTTTFSQGFSITILQSDAPRVFIETITAGDQVRVNIFPLDEAISYRLQLATDMTLQNNTVPIVKSALVSSEHRFSLKLGKAEVQSQPIVIPKTVQSTTTANPPTALKKYRLGIDCLVSADTNSTAITTAKNLREYPNNNLLQISPACDIINPKKLSLVGVLSYTKSGIGSQVAYEYDAAVQVWQPLPSYNDVRNNKVYFASNSQKATVALFNQTQTTDGVASWYDQSKYRSFKYQGGNFAAHRDYPKGTRLRVTRLKTGVSIEVVINDWGPEAYTGRILDLDKKAFQQLSTIGAGEIYVKIEKIDG